MGKKLFVLLIVVLFTITGCSNNTGTEPKVSDKLEVLVENINIELNYNGSFSNLSFKYPSKAMTSNLGTYYLLDYMNGDDLVVRIGMYYFKDKTPEKVMENSKVVNTGSKTINDIKWDIYETKQDDGKNVYNYVAYIDEGTYTITFISGKDINDFMSVFMNNVKNN